MWVSSGLEWRTEPIRTRCGCFRFLLFGLWLWLLRKRANERRSKGWFFSGRNCAMYRIMGSREASASALTVMLDSNSETAVGGKMTVGSRWVCLLRDGPQIVRICADVHEELHMTTSTWPPTQPYSRAKASQYFRLMKPFRPLPAPALTPLSPVWSSSDSSMSVEMVG